jgi:transposase
VRTPRSTLSAWAGQTGAQLMPLFEAHKDFVLGSRVLHGDETTVKLLDPGAGKTKTAYMWAYARGVFDPDPGVVYDLQHRPRQPIPLQLPRPVDRHPGA